MRKDLIALEVKYYKSALCTFNVIICIIRNDFVNEWLCYVSWIPHYKNYCWGVHVVVQNISNIDVYWLVFLN